MFLRQETEGNDDHGRDDLGNGREYMQVLHHKIDQGIVQEKIDGHDQHIPEQLHPPAQVRRPEDNVFGQYETERKSNAKRHTQGCVIGLQGNKSQVQDVLLHYKIVADIEKKNVKEHVAAAANGITKRLQGDYLLKRRIKKID
jgi:hypothetical protein